MGGGCFGAEHGLEFRVCGDEAWWGGGRRWEAEPGGSLAGRDNLVQNKAGYGRAEQDKKSTRLV